jgi:hypothetical protein
MTQPDRPRATPNWVKHVVILVASTLIVMIAGGIAYLHVFPGLRYGREERVITQQGLGNGKGIPDNYTVPALASPTATKSELLVQGANPDTLYTIGYLDLRDGPDELHVPDMGGRYYDVEFIDPADGTVFHYVGRRTAGTKAGEFLIVGPDWHGRAPAGMPRIVSPDNNVFVIGRTLVEHQNDVSAAYQLARQITVTRAG